MVVLWTLRRGAQATGQNVGKMHRHAQTKKQGNIGESAGCRKRVGLTHADKAESAHSRPHTTRGCLRVWICRPANSYSKGRRQSLQWLPAHFAPATKIQRARRWSQRGLLPASQWEKTADKAMGGFKLKAEGGNLQYTLQKLVAGFGSFVLIRNERELLP